MKELGLIRRAVFDYLDDQIDGVDHYFCGHTVFLHDETDLPAICVFVDDAQSDDIDLCGAYWSAKLHIQVYLKSTLPAEDELDELMDAVIAKCADFESEYLERFELSAVSYINDDKQAEWIIGAIQYDIAFYRKGAD
ncbi:phage tail terminator protein [Pasteurella bettyae]|uniref:phage tail terminator protein n=1 Tax=Pasteurella bettyae TaxID=752 RepID=UPI003D26E5DA